MRKKIRIGQGRAIPAAWRLFLTLITVLGIATLLETTEPRQLGGIVGMVILSALVPAYWTSRRVLEIDISDHSVSTYLWIMGRKFLARSLGTATGFQVDRPGPSRRANLLVMLSDKSILPLLHDLHEEKLEQVQRSLEVTQLPRNESKKP